MLTLKNVLSVLLLFIPISIAGHFLGWSEPIIFITSALAIIPLAAWMGTATEEIAVVMGPALGGLLNATFGNATELIIALVALNAGLIDVVKASITGSIIGNLLLVMGFSMLLGGLKYKEQTFQPIVARVNASSLNLAVIAMLLPTAVDYTSTGIDADAVQKLSIAVSIVLICVYGLTLLFSMKTHTYLYDVSLADMDPEELAEANLAGDDDHGQVNLPLWIGVLLGCTRRCRIRIFGVYARSCYRAVGLDSSIYWCNSRADYWQCCRTCNCCNGSDEGQNGSIGICCFRI
jgi:Ca2+:H+ antiporter